MLLFHQSDNEIIFQVYVHRTFLFLFMKTQFSIDIEKNQCLFLHKQYSIRSRNAIKAYGFFMCSNNVFKDQLRDGNFKHWELGNARIKRIQATFYGPLWPYIVM